MSSPSFDDTDRMIGASQSDDPLRGCSLASLIWDTSLLRSFEDSTDAYDHSFPANSVDIFLSHAWSDSGWWKQAALLTCCTPAIIYKVTVVSSMVGAWLCWYLSYEWYELIVLLFALVSFIASFITLLLFKHRNTKVFLDKCCINQVDLVEKMRGISRLSDYLRASDKLIILWTPNYLDRLWCVYELAVFMRTHDKKDVIILNLRHVKLCLSLLLLQLLDTISYYGISAFGERQLSHSSCKMVLSVATSVLVGREVFSCFQDWSTFSSKLSSFSASNAKCTSPDDYTKLKQLIKKLYGSEDHFAACVRGLCLGSTDEKPAPSWLFSRDALRICFVPYIPVIACTVVGLFKLSVGGTSAAMTILPQGVAPLPVPSFTMQVLWYLRIGVFRIFIQFSRVPLMMLLANKLASKVRSRQTNGHPLLTICYCIIFVLYTCLTQSLCGLHVLYDHPLANASIRSSSAELSLLVIGVISISVIFIRLGRSYSHDVSYSILHID